MIKTGMDAGDLAALAAALPALQGRLNAIRQDIILSALKRLNDGVLTDASAKESWIELSVINKLERSIATPLALEAARAEKAITGKQQS